MSLPQSETRFLHTAGWFATDPGFSDPLDPVALAQIGTALAEMASASARVDRLREFRASFVKVLAAIAAAPLPDMTEEEAFKLSLDLREPLYLEMLQFRRAARRDSDAGVLDA